MEPFAGSHGAYFGPSGRHMGHLKGHPGMKWGQLGCISGKRLVQRGRKAGHVLKTISFIMVLKQSENAQGGQKGSKKGPKRVQGGGKEGPRREQGCQMKDNNVLQTPRSCSEIIKKPLVLLYICLWRVVGGHLEPFAGSRGAEVGTAGVHQLQKVGPKRAQGGPCAQNH